MNRIKNKIKKNATVPALKDVNLPLYLPDQPYQGNRRLDFFTQRDKRLSKDISENMNVAVVKLRAF